jgi:hypothetical protein
MILLGTDIQIVQIDRIVDLCENKIRSIIVSNISF